MPAAIAVAWVWLSVASVSLSVSFCVAVRVLKGKWLELLIPKSLEIYSMSGLRHA